MWRLELGCKGLTTSPKEKYNTNTEIKDQQMDIKNRVGDVIFTVALDTLVGAYLSGADLIDAGPQGT